jgi:sodium transport system permease protein
MSSLFTVMKKELLDVLRDRRSVAIALLMGPLLMPVLIIGMSKLATDRAKSQFEKPLQVPVVGATNAPNLVAWLQGQNIVIKPAPADPDEAIRSQKEDVVLRIDGKFGEQWRGSIPAVVEILHDSSRQDASIPVKRLQNLLESYGQGVGALRLVARGIAPAAAQPLRISDRDLATPEARSGMILAAMLPYILIMLSFVGGSYLVIDATAGERERQSLEPLLATPVRRWVVMSGKILAACIVGVVSMVLTLSAFKVSFLFADFGVKLDVSALTIAGVLLVLVPMIMIGTCLLTFIAAGAKSVKEAQSYMQVLMLLPILPTIVLMVNPVKNQLWMLTVPFLAQNQMITQLVRGEAVSAQEWAVYLAAGFAAALLLWWLAARRYDQERLAISA